MLTIQLSNIHLPIQFGTKYAPGMIHTKHKGTVGVQTVLPNNIQNAPSVEAFKYTYK